jgi:hypothetical protein
VIRRPFVLLASLAMAAGGLLVAGTGAGGDPAAAVPAAPEPAATAAPADASSSLILIGTGGLMWSDISRQDTPALWSFLRDGSSAALTVRSVNTNTCPVDGWLSLSAGVRAAAASATGKPACQPVPEVESGVVPGWAEFVRTAADKKFGAQPGLLGEQLARHGRCVQAVGPGAGVGAAYTSGAVPRYAAFDPERLTDLLSACRVTLVDVGSLRDPADVHADEPRPAASREEQLKAIDARVAQVLAAAPNGADLMVASLSDAGRTERLRLVAAKGPRFGPGTLRSPSTRQEGLVQAADLTATVLASAGVPVPGQLGGAALQRVPAEDNSEEAARERLRSLVDYDQASHEVHALVPPFFNTFVLAQVAIYAFVALVWRKRHLGSVRTRLRLLRIARRIAVVAAAVPVSTFLANLLPWWRFPMPMLAVVLSVGLFVAVIAGAALLGPWAARLMGPAAVVSAVTVVVLATDVMTGSRLQLSSLMGLQPVVGGRYYGMGNTTFALFATAALLLCTAVADHLVRKGHPTAAAAAVAVIGGAAVVVDGAPFWGADGGGPPALLPGLAFLVLAILGVRMTLARSLAVAAGTVVLFLLVGVLDWLRPTDSRSHLGRFIQSTIDGGALDIIARKLSQNINILLGSWMTPLVPIALAFVIYILARPTSWGARALERSFDRAPVLRPGLIAIAVTLTIGFAINDSGTVIPAVGATVAVPLIIAVSVRALEDEAYAETATRGERRGRRPTTRGERHTAPPASGSPASPPRPPG